MNKYLFSIIAAVTAIFTLTIQKAFCLTDSISPDLEQSLKSPTNDPSVFHIIFALLFVVFLIYITGVIYSKLNLVGTKTLKEQFKNADLNRAIVISTTQLGQNKNLHVIEINEKRYLIGATSNSINLIKDLGQSTEKAEAEDKPVKPTSNEEDIDNAIKFLYGRSDDGSLEHLSQDDEKEEEFNIHKKYLQ